MSRQVRTTLLAAVFSVFVGVAAGCGGGSGGSAPLGGSAQAGNVAGGSGSGDAISAGGELSGGNAFGLVQSHGKRYEKYVVDPRSKMAREADLPGVHSYIIHFNEQPAAIYDGSVAGYPATRPGAAARKDDRGAKGGRQAAEKASAGTRPKFKSGSAEVIAYKTFLKSRQDMHVQKITGTTGRYEVLQRLTVAVNAVVMRMTQAEALKVSRMNEVRFVERNKAVTPDTDRGPRWIGADAIWEGMIDTGAGTRGEGMLIGIIDSGVAIGLDLTGGQAVDFVGPDTHPSFDDAINLGDSSDGYDYQWTGSYLGACDPTDTDQYLPEVAPFCNDKMVGVFENLDAQDICDDSETMNCDQYGPTDSRIWNYKDTDGHGSHVMSTAGGNVLFDVPVIDADGNPNPDFLIPEMSGVAPHAHIVGFKVCAPSCFFSDIAAATETAIEIGVDVLNMSIGNSYDPWSSTSALGFLNAHAAGIVVANSAGNDGPGANTVNANSSPWVMGVAASTHDRSYPDKFLQDLAGGDSPPPGPLNGLAITGGITADVVYAGNFPTDNGSNNDVEPEQCLDPFPPGTFNGQIVVCDRGAIARVAKGQNVRDGGAGGMVLANIDGGSTSVVADPHVIPAIHMDAANGNAVKAWLASGSDHTGTITPGLPAESDPAAGDILADFSSRGPFTGFNLLAPLVSAPGQDIFAAGAQNLFDHPGEGSDAPAVNGIFGQISGTSMSSPHAAGAAALVSAVHPDWAPSEVIAALSTTGLTQMLKEDGATPADPFDFGGGRIQPAIAVDAGLLLFESATNFGDADPATGGDESALNVSGLVTEECVGQCSWERTVTAERSGTWSVSGSFTSAEPANFTLAAGESQSLMITASAAGLPGDGYSFDFLEFTPSDGSLPSQHLTVAIQPATGNVPDNIDINTGRPKGSWLIPDVTSIGGDALTVDVYGHDAPREVRNFKLAQDSDNGDFLDDLNDGVWWTIHPFPNYAELAVYEITATTSNDLDMFVGLDDNGNGVPDPDDPLICVSATGTAFESCLFDLQGETLGEDVDVWVAIQNWGASDPDAMDDVEFARTVVTRDDRGNLSVEGPVGPIPPLEPFDLRVFFTGANIGDPVRYGRIYLYGDASKSDASFFGNPIVRIVRGPNDVDISMPDLVAARDYVDIDLTVQANRTPEERNYDIRVRVPGGMEYVEGSAEAFGGYFDGNDVFFNVTQPSLLATDPTYDQTTNDPGRSDFSETCNTGFGDGTYLDLFGDFGFDPVAGGDDDTFAFSLAGPTDFYGTVRPDSVNVNTNGFFFFDSDPGSNFINSPIPDPTAPNDMAAVYWTDLITALDFTDPNDPGGITAAVVPGVLSIFEFDNATEWTSDPADAVDSVDFEVFFWAQNDTTPGVPEVIFAYENLDRTSGVPFLTVGVENPSGTDGTQFTFDDPSVVTNGLIVCYDLMAPSSEPTQVSFQVRPKDRAEGNFKTFKLFDSVDDPGATGTRRDETKTYVFGGFYEPVKRGYVHEKPKNLFLAFRIFDPYTGENVQDRDAELVVTYSDGTEVERAPFEPRGLDYFYKMVTKDSGRDVPLELGVYTLTVIVDGGAFQYDLDITLTD